MKYRIRHSLALALLLLAFLGAAVALSAECAPTPADQLGPFYKSGAPARSKVGTGYVLEGRVMSAGDCTPLPGAIVELWMAGPDGAYADDYRATLAADEKGGYRFESHFPPAYDGRPPHIHIRVSATGHEVLVTQHYPKRGTRSALFDLVLRVQKQ
jgi:protocatechuate 3,4-dioxygenase beta subunit